MSDILFKPTHLPISKPFHALLANILSEHQAKSEVQATSKEVVMNFRDSSYSAEDGGFHPVEIALSQSSDGQWCIEYITDFAYVGNHFPELERCLDFDFQRGDFFTAYHGWNPVVVTVMRESSTSYGRVTFSPMSQRKLLMIFH